MKLESEPNNGLIDEELKHESECYMMCASSAFVRCLKNQKDPTFDMHLVVYCMTKLRRQKADRRKIQPVGEVWKNIQIYQRLKRWAFGRSEFSVDDNY